MAEILVFSDLPTFGPWESQPSRITPLGHRLQIVQLLRLSPPIRPQRQESASLTQTEERDISIGEAGDVSIGDLHAKVAHLVSNLPAKG
jgi:hypothetical protein